MTSSQPAPPASGRPGQTIKWALTSVVFAVLVLSIGVGMVAAIGRTGSTATWIRWGNVGQAFGALNSVLSGAAIAALIVTFLMQFQELQTQRAELAAQRESMVAAEADLRRCADVQVRMLHVDLLKMAMADPHLAVVWPPLAMGISNERNRQYLYANLIIQHQWLISRLSGYTDAEVQSTVRYLFASPLFREFWAATAKSRASILVPGTSEYRFAGMADAICQEYESVLACSNDGIHTDHRVPADDPAA